MKPFLIIFPLSLVLLLGRDLEAKPLAEDPWGVSYTTQPSKEKSFARHGKGMHGLGVVGGYASISPIIAFEWSYLFTASWKFQVLASGGQKSKSKTTSYRNLQLQPMFYRTVYTDYEMWNFNIGMGLTSSLKGKYRGWKKVKEQQQPTNESNDKGDKGKKKSAFALGVAIGGEVEAFVWKRLVLTLAAGPMVSVLKNPADRISFFVVAGIKINV